MHPCSYADWSSGLNSSQWERGAANLEATFVLCRIELIGWSLRQTGAFSAILRDIFGLLSTINEASESNEPESSTTVGLNGLIWVFERDIFILCPVHVWKPLPAKHTFTQHRSCSTQSVFMWFIWLEFEDKITKNLQPNDPPTLYFAEPKQNPPAGVIYSCEDKAVSHAFHQGEKDHCRRWEQNNKVEWKVVR